MVHCLLQGLEMVSGLLNIGKLCEITLDANENLAILLKADYNNKPQFSTPALTRPPQQGLPSCLPISSSDIRGGAGRLRMVPKPSYRNW